MIKKRMLEIQARKVEIRKLLESNEAADLDTLETELRNLETEYKGLERRAATLENLKSGEATPAVITGVTELRNTAETVDPAIEYRNAWLKTLQGQLLTESEQRAYTTSDNSAGAVIPETTLNKIKEKMEEVAPVLERCEISYIPGNVKIPVEGTIADAKNHTQNAAVTPDEDKLIYVDLTGYEILKLVSISRSVKAMSISAFESWLVIKIAKLVANKVEKIVFAGSGTGEGIGVLKGGSGTNGAYVENTDQLTIAAGTSVSETHLVKINSMLKSPYHKNGVCYCTSATFFNDIYPIMNNSKNNAVTFSNNTYYVLGKPVEYTGSLPEGVVIIGDFSYLVGNFSEDVKVEKSEESGFRSNSTDYKGTALFDCKPVTGLGAFVKLVHTQATG